MVIREGVVVTATCEHCDRPVLEALMRKSGRPILLDPEPHALGNLQLVELGAVAQFIAPEYRDPKSRWFVPPAERYQSHMASCPQNERTCSEATHTFIADVNAALKETSTPERTGKRRSGVRTSKPRPGLVGKASGSAAPASTTTS